MTIRRTNRGFGFENKLRRIERLRGNLPRIIANDSLNWFLDGFRQGGGKTDTGRWVSRRRTARRNAGRALLVDTGALKRDLRVRRLRPTQIILGTARIHYARRHNEGITDKLGRRMPKREFLGNSKGLNKKNKKTILKELDKILG